MKKFQEFWRLVIDVWETGVFGIDLGHIIVALIILLVFLMIRRAFGEFVLKVIRKHVAKTKTTLDDHALDVLERPIRFLPVVLGVFFASEFMRPEGDTAQFMDSLIRSLIAFTIFWGFHALVGPLSIFFTRLEKVFSSAMVMWLIKTIKFAVIFVGAAAILEIWGIEVGPILAGFGLFGVAVALGAQDLFKNLIAGLLIIAEKRFQIGDWIRIDGVVEGTVETIGFRSTMVRRFDKAPVYVPNTKLSDGAVTNFSEMTQRRIYWKIGVEYRTTVGQLRKIRDEIETYVLGSDEFEHPPTVPTFVRIDAFSDSSIDIMLYCFTRTTDWGKWLEIKERLAYRIKDIIEGAGSAFAFPSQSIYVETLPDEAPETFVPPGTASLEPPK